MHRPGLSIRILIPRTTDLPRDAFPLEDDVHAGVLDAPVCTQHVDLEAEELLEVDEEALELLRYRVLSSRE